MPGHGGLPHTLHSKAPPPRSPPPGLPPRGRAWGRRRIQPAAPPARPPAPRPRGTPGAREACGAGAGRGRRGAQGLGRPPPPAALPRPGPRRPRHSPRSVRRRNPRRSCLRVSPRPPDPPPPAPATPAPAPLTLSFSARGLAWAGKSPASHQRDAGSGLGSSADTAPALGFRESLSLSNKRAKKAGLPACTGRDSSLLQHHYRHCEDITPQSSSSALRNDNFPTILEAEKRGAKGESAPAPEKVQLSTSHLWKESTLAVSTGA
ncbi:neural Wiskott-Aldrich syndrome protein-like [Mesocricetus auratus]|uniref:Neural Wiskott-Aldrich syndrome protein-like n=1 Tax=Mesocricetus auratus TaxID=10036 RepID=A0ABM2Y1I8_MESAU|nr:neural Wiskott-Aldrich syndrome protein-like [Mesocricetus auratus]